MRASLLVNVGILGGVGAVYVYDYDYELFSFFTFAAVTTAC